MIWRKWAWIVALLCLPILSGRAEAPAILSCDGVTLSLKDVQGDGGWIDLSLLCENASEAEQSIILFAPAVNGADTMFASGWESLALTLEPGSLRNELITLRQTGGELERISLRAVCGGRITPQITLERRGGAWCVAAEGAVERALLEAGTAYAWPQSQSIALRDQMTEAEASALEQGYAVVCLMLADGDSYIPFCRLPVQAEPDGRVQASYSGMTVTFTDNPSFPLPVEESSNDGDFQWRVSGIALSGDAVFFAELSCRIAQDPQGGVSVSQVELDSPELGGVCEGCPLGLFREAAVYLPSYAFSDEGDCTQKREVDGWEAVLSLEQPLGLDLRPAEELGEVYVYYEYWFDDGSTTVRTPVALRCEP